MNIIKKKKSYLHFHFSKYPKHSICSEHLLFFFNIGKFQICIYSIGLYKLFVGP